ncbi:MAG: hypothetical protein GWP11_02585 [Proteobacteria bacterium]|nr:hypothetical protein [Pseudomonadota bacterium]
MATFLFFSCRSDLRFGNSPLKIRNHRLDQRSAVVLALFYSLFVRQYYVLNP